MPTITSLNGVDLKKLISRRHPEYNENIEHWNFSELSYKGGRAWFDNGNLFKFYKEGEKEYKERLKRSYRANHTKRVVETINQYLFRSLPVRDKTGVPGHIKGFWENTGGRKNIDELSREIDKWVSVFGTLYVVVDRAQPNDDPATFTRQRRDETLPYAYILFPQRVLDFAYGNDGLFDWVLVQEDSRSSEISIAGDIIPQWRLWTRTHWFLIKYVLDGEGKPTDKFEVTQGEHGLGMVPVVQIAAEEGTKWSCPGLTADVVYMDRALVNYGSMLDEIIYEQTFSQLTIPAEALLPGTKESNQIIAAAKNRIFVYNSTSPGAKPEFISPDASQAGVLLKAMEQLKKDIYAVSGTDNDANSQSASKGKEYASGKVRQFDHSQIENILLGKARASERAEEHIIELVNAWMGDKAEINLEWVQYPNKFDVRGLAAELEIASELTALEAPLGVLRGQMKMVVDKTFPRMTISERQVIDTEIDAWEPAYIFERKIEKRKQEIAVFTAETQADAMKDDNPDNDEKVGDKGRQDLKAGGGKSPLNGTAAEE